MHKLFFFLILFLCTQVGLSQIKVIDKVRENISTLNQGTVYEIKADELQDGRVKITFRADTSGQVDLGYIYLQSRADFEDLFTLIDQGFQEKKEHTVVLDLGDSRLTLYFYKIWFGSMAMTMIHSYATNPYATKKTKRLSHKDISKLFAKQ